MAHAIYDRMWADAMSELKELLKIEDPTLYQAPGQAAPVIPEMKPDGVYSHARIMYLKYTGVFKKLERVYRGFTHPQKREDVAEVIRTVGARMAQLHAIAMKYAPYNPEVAAAKKGQPFVPLPWAYLPWDDLLAEAKMQPQELDLPTPHYVTVENEEQLAKRDAAVLAQIQEKLGVDMVAVESRAPLSYDSASPGSDSEVALGLPGALPAMTLEEAIACIVRNEKGRQGKQKAAQQKRKHEDATAAVLAAQEAEATGNAYIPPELARIANKALGINRFKMNQAKADGRDGKPDGEEEEEEEEEDRWDMDLIAVEMQRVARGFLARQRTKKAWRQEAIFLGAKANAQHDPAAQAREQRLLQALQKRRYDQSAFRAGLKESLPDLQSLVLDEEGHHIREHLKAERDAWLRNHMLTNGNQPPDEVANYYEFKQAQADAAAAAAAPPAEAAAPAGKGADPKKDAKKGAVAAPEPEKPPALIGHNDWSTEVESLLSRFHDLWVGRDESQNTDQRHDIELAKGIVRPAVQEALRLEVDQQVAEEIENLKAAAAGKKKKPAKKKKPPKEKKKKEKPLPGAKLCPGMDVHAMLAQLVEFKMVNQPDPSATFASFYGEHNMLLSKYNSQDTPAQRHPESKVWIPADPSMAQIRDVLLATAVLPLGSTKVRKQLHAFCEANKVFKGKAPRSVLLYGPPGSGKTHLAQAVANACGALFLNVSAGVTEGKCPEKGGQAKLLHLAFEVAKSADYGPAVIYIDQVEKMFPGGAGKGGKKAAKPDPNGPARFKKDLLTYINSILPEHSVIVIAATSEPWSTDVKSAVDAFDVALYVPPLDHGSRVRAWKREVALAIGDWEAERKKQRAAAEAKASKDVADAVAAGLDPEKMDKPVLPPVPKLPSIAAAMQYALGGPFEPLPVSTSAAVSVIDALPTHPWLDGLNFSALAAVTAGYTAGSIKQAVQMTLTHRRLDRWAFANKAVKEGEFVSALASLPKMYAEDADLYRVFTDGITGLGVARQVVDPNAAAAKGKKK